MFLYTTCRSCGGPVLFSTGLPDPPTRTDFWHEHPCKPVIYRRERLEMEFEQAAQMMRGAALAGKDKLVDKSTDEMERLEAEMKELDAQPPKLGAAAVQYARWGWPVFPIVENEKRPASRNGFKDATTDVVKIQSYWESHPMANIGVATGHKFEVIDVDTEKITASGLRKESGFPVFEKCLAAINPEDGRGPLPDCYGISRTPSGGLHLLILPTGVGNAEGWLPGIDYRGLGGYIVAPPSQINGARYRWWVPPAPQVCDG